MTVKVRTRVSVKKGDGEVAIEDFTDYLDEMPWDVGEKIEAATGVLFDDWLAAVDRGSVAARRALAWVVERQSNPSLLLSQVNGPMRALRVQNLAKCPKCADEQPVGRRPVRDENGRSTGTTELVCLTCTNVISEDEPGEPVGKDGSGPASESDDASTAPS